MGATTEPSQDDQMEAMIDSLSGEDLDRDTSSSEDPDQPEDETEPQSGDDAPDETEESGGTEQGGDETVEASEEGGKVEELEEKIEQLESKLDETESSDEEEPSEEGEGEVGEIEVDFSDEEILTDEETHGEILSNSENFEEFMRSFAEKVSARTQEQMFEELPALVEKRVQQRVQQQVPIQVFWQNNPELAEHRDVVAKKASEYSSENPNAGIQELLEHAGKAAREELDIEQKAEEIDESAQNDEPAFAPDQGSGPAPSSDEDRTDQQEQIDQMLESL